MNIAHVFVVDDDATVCRIVSRMLSHELYSVQASHSVVDALGTIEQMSFDVYLLDYKLPDGSGLDIAERIRSKWGAVPIILISGYDPSSVALRAKRLCINEFLLKPFSQEKLCEAVKNAIDSSSSAVPALSEAKRAPLAAFIRRQDEMDESKPPWKE